MGILQGLREGVRLATELLEQVMQSESALERLTTKMEANMATLQDFMDLLGQIDAETTRIGVVVLDLLAKLQAGGLTSAEEDAVFAQAQAELAKLKDIGATPPTP